MTAVSSVPSSRWRHWQPWAITPLLRMLTIRFAVPADAEPHTTCERCARPLDARSVAAGPLGRCACGARYGPAPLLLEAVTLGCAAVLVFTPGLSGWERAAYGWWSVCAVVLAFTDLAVHRLPRSLAFGSVAGLLVLLTPAAISGGHPADLGRAAAAGLLVAGLLALGALLPSTGLGGGDVTVGLSVGAAAGWISWFAVVTAMFAGWCLVAVSGVALIIARRATRSTALPLGPALLAGTLLAVVLLRGGAAVALWHALAGIG